MKTFRRSSALKIEPNRVFFPLKPSKNVQTINEGREKSLQFHSLKLGYQSPFSPSNKQTRGSYEYRCRKQFEVNIPTYPWNKKFPNFHTQIHPPRVTYLTTRRVVSQPRRIGKYKHARGATRDRDTTGTRVPNPRGSGKKLNTKVWQPLDCIDRFVCIRCEC